MLPLLFSNLSSFISDKNQIKNITSKPNKSIPNSIKMKIISLKGHNINLALKGFGFSALVLTPFLANGLSETNPNNLVVDDSGVLTKSSVSFLEKNSQKAFETSGSRLYIVSLRTLPYGEDASEFTKNLFLKWELKNNDVLVVLVNKIAKGAVFAGSEVKGLSEQIKKSIGEETFAFKAKDEQYSSAAIDVSNRLVSILTNKGDPGAPSVSRSNDTSSFKSAKVTEERRSKYVAIIIILLVIAFVVPMVQFFYYVKDE